MESCVWGTLEPLLESPEYLKTLFDGRFACFLGGATHIATHLVLGSKLGLFPFKEPSASSQSSWLPDAAPPHPAKGERKHGFTWISDQNPLRGVEISKWKSAWSDLNSKCWILFLISSYDQMTLFWELLDQQFPKLEGYTSCIFP